MIHTDGQNRNSETCQSFSSHTSDQRLSDFTSDKFKNIKNFCVPAADPRLFLQDAYLYFNVGVNDQKAMERFFKKHLKNMN